MSNIAGVEVILTHFYARTKENMPLAAGPEEERFSEVSPLGKHPLYKKIRKEMQKGRTLSDALSSVKGFPPSFLKVIKRGEDSGNLAKALKIVLDHYPIFTRFRLHMFTLYAYFSVVLVFLFAFIGYFAFLFRETHATVLGQATADVPALFRFLFLVPHPYSIALLVLAVIAAFVIVRYGFKVDVVGLIIRWTPVMKRNYFRILSLELGTNYHYNLELGLPPQQALAQAVEGLGKGEISESLRKAISLVGNGESLSGALASESSLAHMPVVEIIGLGEATGKASELIRELNDFLHKYLLANLDNEMQNLFRWCVLVCGIFVGIGVVYVFNAILYSYSSIILY